MRGECERKEGRRRGGESYRRWEGCGGGEEELKGGREEVEMDAGEVGREGAREGRKEGQGWIGGGWRGQ